MKLIDNHIEKLGDDLKNDEYTYPEGVLSVPIRNELEVVVR